MLQDFFWIPDMNGKGSLCDLQFGGGKRKITDHKTTTDSSKI